MFKQIPLTLLVAVIATGQRWKSSRTPADIILCDCDCWAGFVRKAEPRKSDLRGARVSLIESLDVDTNLAT